MNFLSFPVGVKIEEGLYNSWILVSLHAITNLVCKQLIIILTLIFRMNLNEHSMMKSEREYVCKGVGISFLPRQLSWPEFAVNKKFLKNQQKTPLQR